MLCAAFEWYVKLAEGRGALVWCGGLKERGRYREKRKETRQRKREDRMPTEE